MSGSRRRFLKWPVAVAAEVTGHSRATVVERVWLLRMEERLREVRAARKKMWVGWLRGDVEGMESEK